MGAPGSGIVWSCIINNRVCSTSKAKFALLQYKLFILVCLLALEQFKFTLLLLTYFYLDKLGPLLLPVEVITI